MHPLGNQFRLVSVCIELTTRMKLQITIALCSLFLFFGEKTIAQTSNMAGGNITYKAIDTVNYEVTVKLYAQCDSGLVINDTLKVSWPGGGFSTKMNLQKVSDVTGRFVKCTNTSRCAGNGTIGFSEYIYKTTVNISNNACKVTFSYSGGKRLGSITTGAAATPTYLFAELNKCLGINNSTQSSFAPQLIVPLGQDLNLSQGFLDTLDGDSLRFDLVEPQSSVSSNVGYSGQWSYRRPITFLGFPNASIGFPGGFYLDTLSGQLSFRPAKKDEVTVWVIEAKEYRNINGKMEEVGRTRFEQLINVIAFPNNKLPSLRFTNQSFCVGKRVCITVTTSDQDNADTLTLLSNTGIKGASVTIDSTKKLPTATICWTPTQADVRNWPHLLTLQALDNGCSPNGVITRTYAIMVNPRVDSSAFEMEKKEMSCNRLRVKMRYPRKAGQFRGFIVTNATEFGYNTPDSVEVYFTTPGWAKFRIWSGFAAGCLDTLYDSVLVAPSYKLLLKTTPDTIVCRNDSFTVATIPQNGSAPYQYRWQGPGVFTTASSFKQATTVFRRYNLRVIDSVGCFARDTVDINVYTPGTIQFSHPDSVCDTGTPFLLTAKPIGGKWTGPGVALGLFVPTLAGAGIKTISYEVKDSNNCTLKANETIKVNESPTLVQFLANSVIGRAPHYTVFGALSTPMAQQWFWQLIRKGDNKTDTATTYQPLFEHTFKDTGIYTVYLTASIANCSTNTHEDDYITVGSLAGVGELEKIGIKIYPNPLASSQILIIEGGNVVNLIVCDITGRTINANWIIAEDGKLLLETKGLAAGTYTLQLFCADLQSYNTKLIVLE